MQHNVKNPDNDPHDNRFEFLTGYDPTNSGDFFTLEVLDLTGTTTSLQLSKIIPGTRYRIERSLDINAKLIKKLDLPGSPCLAQRPRSWRSMRRDS